MTTDAMPAQPVFRIEEDDVLLSTWFERDRSSVILYLRESEDTGDYGPTLAEFWDETVTSLVEDGFLDGRDWKGSAFRYAKSVGLDSLTKVEANVNEALTKVWEPLMRAAQEATHGDVDHLLAREDDVEKAYHTLPCSLKQKVSEAMQGVLEDRPDYAIGYQILDQQGFNIHAEEDDPFGLSSFAVLVGDAVDQAKEWVKENPGYSVEPVGLGEIEEPEFVSAVVRRPAPAPTPG